MIAPLIAALLLAAAAPAGAQTIAIIGGTVAHRRRFGADPGRHGRHPRRPDRRRRRRAYEVPAGTQVIDATGKWVTPGIVAGFSRLGLAEVDLSARAAPTTPTANGPFNAAIDVVPAINPLDTTIAVNRADGVTRALVAPSAGKNIFAGQGAVIDTGADMDPITAARKFQFVELGQTGADKAGGSRASATSCFAMRCAKRRSCAATRADTAAGARRCPTNATGRSSAIPMNRGILDPTRGAARTCC